ncbi:MAG: hypothetical protein KC777_02430 [Cyanobacteria bacterium HKST-UBA02]|nr:hypothetical protein [Cyanobacteria bacterium HKST-UBA02]
MGHNPKANLASGEPVGEKPFFTLEKPETDVEPGHARIFKAPLPRIPGDNASGTMAPYATYGEGGLRRTVAKFQAPEGTRILGLSSKASRGYETVDAPALILEVPNVFVSLVEMEVHLIYGERGGFDASPDTDWNSEPPAGLPAPAGLVYVGSYSYRSFKHEVVLVFQPQSYIWFP